MRSRGNLPPSHLRHPRHLLPALILGLVAWGCAGGNARHDSGLEIGSLGEVTSLQLAEELRDFAERYFVTLKAASNSISGSTTDIKIRKNTLYWRLVTIPHVLRSIYHQEPLAGLLDVWAFCVQSRLFFASPDGEEVFGEWTPMALEAARTNEQEIEDVAHKVLSDDQFARADEAVTGFAEAHPIRGLFARRSARPAMVQASKAASLSWVTGLPLKPVRAFMDESAQAIRKAGDVADRLTTIVRGMPDILRWQVELLLYDLEERQTVVSTVASLERVSRSADRIAGTADKLPEELKTQLTTVISEIDSRQAGLQSTLREAQEVLDKLEATIAGTGELASSVERSTANIVEAGDKWHGAVQAVDTMIQGFRGDPEAEEKKEPEPTGDEGGFDIRDYTRTAERTEAAAVEIRALTGDFRRLLESGALGSAAWTLALCGMALIAAAGIVFFASLLAYRLAASRLAPRRREDSPGREAASAVKAE